jgi:hypothetical protein
VRLGCGWFRSVTCVCIRDASCNFILYIGCYQSQRVG